MTPPDFPAGPYAPEPAPTAARRAELIAEIERLPGEVRGLVAGLADAQLDTPYKNWTVRQITHHLADSHLNAFVRFRLTLTEDSPTIKPYDEGRWAELADTKTMPVEPSLRILDGLHARWVALLRAMTDADFTRAYDHPELKRRVPLGDALGLYAHHGRHHAAQIAWVRRQNGW